MSLLAVIKILTIPALLWMVALISKQFGPMVAGIVSGLRIFSGPIVFYIALEQGADFAARSALGAFAGKITGWVFMLVFALMLPHMSITITFLTATAIAIGLSAISVFRVKHR